MLAGIKGFFQAEGEDATFGAKPYIEAGVSTSLSTGIGADLSTALPVYLTGTIFPSTVDPDSKGSQDPQSLNLWLPTFVDFDAVTVEAASVRVSQQGGSLTESEAIHVLEAAGWPTELIPAALRVAWCESKWSPWAEGDSGRSVGWFQLNKQTWFRYAGEDPEMWADPVVNARTALATYYYDIGRGYQPFAQWSCRP